jgi:glycosyltransferase involved in cell wall biosynthesis
MISAASYVRRLPAPLQALLRKVRARLLGTGMHAYILPHRRPRRRFKGEHVAVVGFFTTRSGLGRGAHLLALGLEAQGHRVTRVDVPTERGTRSDKACVSAADLQREPLSDIIFVLNPPHLYAAISMFEAAWLRGRCIVLHWAWELDLLPATWQQAGRMCDEVWASSPFTASAISRAMPHVPTTVVPYPADLEPILPPTAQERARVRRKLGIESRTFVLGYSFAVTSNYERKNPDALVDAFQKAFSANCDARLIVRCLDPFAFRAAVERLRTRVERDPRIILVTDAAQLGIAEFYAAIDLYVSTSRSEGYGLNLVEASQAGIPVIALEWSLAPDILARHNIAAVSCRLVPVVDPQGNYSNVPGAVWAEPMIEVLAERLRAYRSQMVSNEAALPVD